MLSALRTIARCGALLAFANAGIAAQEPTPVHAVAAGATGAERGYRIAGVVTNAVTGEPVPHATVTLVDELTRDTVKSAQTGSDGQFAVEHVEAGKYGLQVARRGYMTSFFNAHEELSSAVVAGEGQDTEHIEFHLSPGAMVHGMVTDDAGEAVAQAQVMLMRKSRRGGMGERLERAISGNTDDQGGFEFWDLMPGTYFMAVKATPWFAMHASTMGKRGTTSRDVSGEMAALDVAYPVTYYDGTTEEAGAAPIALSTGDRTEVNLALHAVPAVRLVVRTNEVQAGGRAYVDTPLFRQSVLGEEEFAAPTNINPGPPGSGWVEVDGLAPGRYEVLQGNPQRVAEVDAESSGGQEVNMAGGEATVDVEVSVAMADGSAVPQQLNLALVPDGLLERTLMPSATIGPNTMRIRSVAPGNYTLMAMSNNETLAVVTTGTAGRMNPESRVEVKARSLHLTAMLEKGDTTIKGFARKDGKGVAGMMLVLVPQNAAGNLAMFRRDQSDSDGSFALRNVVAGRYTVVAIEDGWELDWARPEVIERYLPKGTSVTVSGTSDKVMHLPGTVTVQPR